MILLGFLGSDRDVILTRRHDDGWYRIEFGNCVAVDPDLDRALYNATCIRAYQYTGVWV